MITLASVVANKLTSGDTNAAVDGMKPSHAATDWTNKALLHCVAAASLLRDYRRRYGLKVTLAFIFQAAAVSAFSLLPYLRPEADIPAAFTRDQLDTAFFESFRCLLGMATRVMIARGVVQMIRKSAAAMGIPDDVLTEAAAEVVWRRGDSQMIKSDFPRYAIEAGEGASSGVDDGERRMEEMLKDWEGKLVVQ